MDKIFTYQVNYDGNDEHNIIQFCAKNIIEVKKLYFNWCKNDMNLSVPFPITNIEVIFNKDDAEEFEDEYGTPEDYKNFKEPEAKIFRIPMEWCVCQKINIKAHTPEEAVAYIKNNIDTIALGTEPEYIDGTHIISGDDGKSVAELVEELTAYWNLTDALTLKDYPYADNKETPSCV